MMESTTVDCPYCGATVELLLDPGGGRVESFVEDCEVCCRPWHVRVVWRSNEAPRVEVSTDAG